jgi:hypothetical protein
VPSLACDEQAMVKPRVATAPMAPIKMADVGLVMRA